MVTAPQVRTPNGRLRDPRVRKLGSLLGGVAGAWFWLAVVGMFFTKRYPFLEPLVMWTFRIYFGALAAAVIGVMVVAPGVYTAKEFNDTFGNPHHSPLERRLTSIWCAGAGILLSVVLGSATALLIFGVLADIKLWFLGVCWAALLVAWCILGVIGRRLLRALNRGRDPRSVEKDPSGA